MSLLGAVRPPEVADLPKAARMLEAVRAMEVAELPRAREAGGAGVLSSAVAQIGGGVLDPRFC